MGDFANDALNDAIDHENDFEDYVTGNKSLEEALESGVVDEFGSSPNQLVNSRLRPDIMDVESLRNELALCDGAMNGSSECINRLMGLTPTFMRQQREVVHYWRSGDKLFLPKDMTDSHLNNAIKYAERNGQSDMPIVKLMIKELSIRKGDNGA